MSVGAGLTPDDTHSYVLQQLGGPCLLMSKSYTNVSQTGTEQDIGVAIKIKSICLNYLICM